MGWSVVSTNELQHLRVLIANERRDRRDLLAEMVAGLGHEVIERSLNVTELGVVTASARPDVALIGVGSSSEQALELISEIVHEASCPVIALLPASDPGYLREAARRGVFACILHDDPTELQGVIDITLQRFAEYRSLQDAFDRRAVIEQAKGIMMARHAIGSGAAFAMLREHSQNSGRKLVDVAQSVVDSHLLLVPADAPAVSELAEP
jgi:AmiR/NasT family two-component response regulator